MEVSKSLLRKINKRLANFGRCKFNSSPFAKISQLIQTKLFFPVYLTELSWSLWENLDLGRVYRPHSIRSVILTLSRFSHTDPPFGQ